MPVLTTKLGDAPSSVPTRNAYVSIAPAAERRRGRVVSPTRSLSTRRILRRRASAAAAVTASPGRLGGYIDHRGKRRELVAYRGPGQSTLVIDHEHGSRADCRLVAHLAADEPVSNARVVASVYLADERRPRCRRVTREDIKVAPATELHAGRIIVSDAVPAGSADVLIDRHGRVYRLEFAASAHMKIPQARWHSYPPEGHEGPVAIVSLRTVIGALEDYERARALTCDWLAAYNEDPTVSTTALHGELRRVFSSRIVLNRGLREAVRESVATNGVSYSQIAMLCGRIKRDARGNLSGETSWLARRLGVAPEGGKSAPTPWIHSDVLALIARHGLKISPREAELA